MATTASQAAVTEEQRDAVIKYQRLREQVDELYSKLSQIESDRSEHTVVIKSLNGLDGDRRCWHQVGAVLAEKKVKEVLPLLCINRDQFAETAKKINDDIQSKETEITELQTKYKIVFKRK